MINTSRRITGNTLIVLGSILLLGSAGVKLAHIPAIVSQMASMGFPGWKLTFVAVLEVSCAVLFLIPATRSFGLLLVSSYLGGAIATHFQHAQSILPPSIVLTVLWLGSWLRHPAVLWNGRNGENQAERVTR
jgi:DoxX-like family